MRRIAWMVLLIAHFAYANEVNYIKTKITAPQGEILAEIADTQMKRARGLSYRHHLPPSRGMLFVYKTPGYQPIWMKGMNFAIDVLWLNRDQTVTYIVYHFSPNTYRKKVSHRSPQPDTWYVLELPAGDANRLGITVGTRLSFELPSSK